MSENQRMFIADVIPGEEHKLEDGFAEILFQLQQQFDGLPLWIFWDGENPISWHYNSLALKNSEIPTDRPSLLLIYSFGGNPRAAYQIARLFNRRGGFIALIPGHAKSAATLLALGAREIYMGTDAELGPLDAQLSDNEREIMISALDEVHSLGRLNAAALEVFDQTMILLTGRTSKKIEVILPHTLSYTANFMRPLIEKIDAVHYTQSSRTLRVSEEYAIRLLSSDSKHTHEDARSIASKLVEKYPEHGFVIDSEEARRIGLRVPQNSDELSLLFDALIPYFSSNLTILGQFKEESDEHGSSAPEQGTTPTEQGTISADTDSASPDQSRDPLCRRDGNPVVEGE